MPRTASSTTSLPQMPRPRSPKSIILSALSIRPFLQMSWCGGTTYWKSNSDSTTSLNALPRRRAHCLTSPKTHHTRRQKTMLRLTLATKLTLLLLTLLTTALSLASTYLLHRYLKLPSGHRSIFNNSTSTKSSPRQTTSLPFILHQHSTSNPSTKKEHGRRVG